MDPGGGVVQAVAPGFGLCFLCGVDGDIAVQRRKKLIVKEHHTQDESSRESSLCGRILISFFLKCFATFL